MTDKYTVRYSALTFLAFYLNGALGSSKYEDVTISEVKDQIHQGNIFRYLEQKLGQDVDLSGLSASDRQELISEWEFMANNVDEGRKLCVDKNGICLLVAYLLEGIQLRVRV